MPILNMTGGGGGGSKINIFCQPTEPKTKRGIWIQSSEVNSVKEIICDDSVFMAGAYVPNAQQLGGDLAYYSAIEYNGEIHYFYGNYGNYSNTFAHRIYNISTKEYRFGTIAPTNGAARLYGDAFLMGGEIFLMGGTSKTTSMTVYNPQSDTYRTMSHPNIYDAGFTMYNGFVYAFGGWYESYGSQCVAKIDLSNGVATNLGSNLLPEANLKCCAVTIGDKAYIFGGNKINQSSVYNNKMFVYNYETKVVTIHPAITPFKSVYAKPIAVGTKIYVFSPCEEGLGSYKGDTWVFDTLSGTWTKLMASMNYVNQGIVPVKVGNKIYIYGGYGCNDTSIGEGSASSNAIHSTMRIFSLESKQYSEGQVVMERIIANIGKYNTQLFETSTKIQGISYFPCYFDNVWLFKDKNLQEFPTYYGNGSSWIKFKN